MEFDDVTRSIAVALDDGSAHRLSLSNGRDEVVAKDLLEPEFLAPVDGEWLYATRSLSGIAIRSAASSRTIATLVDETVPPTDFIAVRGGSFLLSQHGRLVFAPADGSGLATVADHIKGVARFDADTIVACSGSGILLSVRVRERTKSIGTCVDQGDFALLATANRDYAVASSMDTMQVSRRGRIERLRMPLGNNSDIALAESGLLTAIDNKGRAYYQVGPGQPWKSNGREDAQATVTRANGTLAAWGYSDGSVRVIDTTSGESWDFVGHDGVVVEVAIVSGERLIVSAGGTEVRAWQLKPAPESDAVALGCQSMNLLGAPGTSTVLADCQNGDVMILEPSRPPVSVHHHESLAFSVAWWGDNACSGGWDGRVICTNIQSGETRIVASHSTRIRWLAAGQDALYYAVGDGTVWRLANSTAAPSMILKHTTEIPRLALDATQTRLAAGSDDGSVFVYDIASGEIRRSPAGLDGHEGRVTQLRWVDGQLVTSSTDGTLRTWSSEMRATVVHRGAEPIAQFARTELGWFVVQNHNQIVPLASEISEVPMPLSDSAVSLASTADQRYVAWLSGDTVSVLDTRELGATVLRLPSTPEKPCISFGKGTWLHYCRTTGEIAAVDVSSLNYVPFTLKQPLMEKSLQ
jgi:hypothetical protein